MCIYGVLYVAWICMGGYALCYIDYIGTPEIRANNIVFVPIAKRFKISPKHLYCGSYGCIAAVFLDVKFIPWCKKCGRKEDLLNIGLSLLNLVGVERFHKWTKTALSSHDVMKSKTKLYRRNLPMVFIEYIQQNKKQQINNDPNYEGLKMMFRKTAKKTTYYISLRL